jgi:acetyltransferase-like isoleucine patch superfamily enzyme
VWKKNSTHSVKKKFTANTFKWRWIRFWMRFADLSNSGRIATRFASWLAPPHKASVALAAMNPKGYIAPSAVIYHKNLHLGNNILVGDRVVIFQNKDGGTVEIGDGVQILRDTTIETGFGGSIRIGNNTSIHPRGQINAYKSSIEIGSGVEIAPNCAFYSYDHGFERNNFIRKQPLQTKGKIVVADHAWLGVGVIVLSGVRIGKGAVIGAGSVVTQDIPIGGIAVGNPARVIKIRGDIFPQNSNGKNREN